jgi:hypothetical membrane protein
MATRKDILKLMIWCGVLAPILRHIAIYLIGYLTPGYSAKIDFLSELGAHGAPHAVIMNTLGIALIGVLMVCFSLGVRKLRGFESGVSPSAILIGVSGVAFLFVALFPCDPGCSTANPSRGMKIHLLAGLVAMGAGVLSPLVYGFRRVRGDARMPIPLVSLLLGVVGVIALILLVVQGANLGPGWIQRVAQTSGDLWVLLLAITSLKKLHG